MLYFSEFKNGYESDTTITRKRDQPDGLTSDQQKMWYREVQKGGEIPRFGLGKPAPEKPKGTFLFNFHSFITFGSFNIYHSISLRLKL